MFEAMVSASAQPGTTDDLLLAATAGFIGRGEQRSRAADLLVGGLVTLTGVAGIGKTRLALAVAGDVRRRYRDGVCFVDLSGLADEELLPHTVAGALGLRDQTLRRPLDVLVADLAGKNLLLVLDTCEHLVHGCAYLAETLRTSAPGVAVLATSRQSLNAAGEHVIVVPPLDYPRPGELVGAAERYEAIDLFEARASEVSPGFSVAEANRSAVAALCARLDGIPLAIELAARQLRSMTLADLAGRLDDSFDLLAADWVPGPSRHRRFSAAIGWSHELCEPEERLAWARLAAFADGFTAEAAAAVCTGGFLEPGWADDLLPVLLDKSIVTVGVFGGPDVPGAEQRYWMPGAVVEFGRRWQGLLRESEMMAERHLAYYLELARRGEAEWFGPDQRAWYARMTGEAANIRAAFKTAFEVGDDDGQTALELAGTLWFYWVGCGRLAEGRHYLDKALARAPKPTRARAKALWVAGYIAILQGDSRVAAALLTECRDQALATGDRDALAHAVHRTGCAALLADDPAESEPLFAEALDLYEALGVLDGNVIMARLELAMAVAFQGDVQRAVALTEQTRDICERHGESWTKSYALYVLSFAAFLAGQIPAATALARDSLVISHSFGDLIGTVLPIELLALCAATSGDATTAAVLQGAAGPIWRTVGLPLFGSRYFGAPHQRCAELIAEALGRDEHQAAVRRGARLGLPDAIALALRENTDISPL